MKRNASLLLLAVLTTVCLLCTTSGAAVQGKCVAGKNKCISKKAGKLLKCEQKAETPGKPMDPNFGDCVDKTKEKFDGGSDPAKGCFEKLENKPGNDCVTFDDTAAAEALVDDCVAQIVEAIDPAPITQTKCGVGKKKCVAKKLKSVLKCYQKAETPGKPMDPNFKGCLDKAMAKYDGGTDPSKGCFVKLESKSGNDCAPPTGNQAALEAIVDGTSCVAGFVALIENTTPTTSTTTVTTTTVTTTTVTTTTTSTTMSTTTTTTSSTTTSSSTTSTTTSSTTTTTGGMTPAFLEFVTGTPGGTCGNTQDGSAVVIKNLTCGGLNIGGGQSIVPEGPTPDGSISRFALNCVGPACNIGPTSTAPPVNSAVPDCTDTGCNFGTPLPIPNPTIPNITTCVLNTWSAPASGTLDLAAGTSSTSVPLNSDIYLTGNVGQPCPKCSATGTPSSPGMGTCDRGPRMGMACTTTSSTGYTRDCPTGGANPPTLPCTPGGGLCIDGSHVGVIAVNLTPLTTGSASATNASGLFCPGQGAGQVGCFGSTACRTITENGAPAGAISLGVPANATLASVFCISQTGNGLVDASANLPGPGAVSLPGTFTVTP
jgi:hypothetical protein